MIDWRQWHGEPFLTDALVVIGWAYAVIAGPLRARIAPGEPWPRAAAVRFYSGLILVYLTVGSPLDRIARLYLFSVNVALQMVVVYPAAGLILSGFPTWMADAAVGRPAARRAFRFLLKPAVCGVVFLLVSSGTYLPRLFEWTLVSDLGRAVQTVAALLSALLFWWPLASPSRVFPSIGFGGRIVYLFLIEVSLTAVFSYILMAEHPMYPAYDLAPRLLPGLDAYNDQVLGGVILSAISSAVLVGALGINFLRWARKSEA